MVRCGGGGSPAEGAGSVVQGFGVSADFIRIPSCNLRAFIL